MNTEKKEMARGWVFYDAECPICRGWAEWSRELLLGRDYHFVPLQSNWARERLGLLDPARLSFEIRRPSPPPSPAPASQEREKTAAVRGGTPASVSEMKLLTADGKLAGGADALLGVARVIWWAWPAWALAQLPGVKPVLRWLYRWLAANRHALGRHCAVENPSPNTTGHITSAFYELP